MRDLGGLHRFMAWDGPILTDSGGLPGLEPLAPPYGSAKTAWSSARTSTAPLRVLSPESCVEIQRALGVDIIHPLDECLAYPATEADTERSLALTADG